MIGFSFGKFLLGDMHTSNGVTTYFSFLLFALYWVGIGLGLGDCGNFRTSAGISTTNGATPSAFIATPSTTPLAINASPISTVSVGVDMTVFNSYCVSLGNSSNTKLAIRASKNSWFIHA